MDRVLVLGSSIQRASNSDMNALAQNREAGAAGTAPSAPHPPVVGCPRARSASSAFTLIEQLCPDPVGVEHACGRIPIRSLLCAARERDLRVTTLDFRNFGDTAGRRDRVVGYGAFALG